MSSVLGNLSGDREHVQWNPADFILLMIKGITTTLSAPNMDWQVEMTPVDFVSEMIVKMSQVNISLVFQLLYFAHYKFFLSYFCFASFSLLYNLGYVGGTREGFPPRQSSAFKCKVSDIYQKGSC